MGRDKQNLLNLQTKNTTGFKNFLKPCKSGGNEDLTAIQKSNNSMCACVGVRVCVLDCVCICMCVSCTCVYV